MKSIFIIITLAALIFLAGIYGLNLIRPTKIVQDLSGSKIGVFQGSRLDLSNKGLTKIPSDVFNKTSLTELDVSHNQLTGAIQAEIRHLKNLKILKANDNLMTGVPAEIGQLSDLEMLDLANNQLTGLPYELGNLKKLKVLNLSGNQYSKADLEIIKKGLPAGVNIIR